ncbi:MAG: UDP-N-acetylmuramate--L-alanine ligase [Patescibacteria group bacterium]
MYNTIGMKNHLSKRLKHVHLVGVKGVAMAALAVYLCDLGIEVSGSDTDDIFPTDQQLHDAGVKVYGGFDANRFIKDVPDLVIYTGAHGGKDNVEVVAACSVGIQALPHGQALGEFMEGKRQVVVAGSHGKTTTSAMAACIFQRAKLQPSYAIGCGAITGLGAAGHAGKGNWFIAEGDEYVTDPHHDLTPRFLWMHPEIVVVTNVDFDHPDVYKDLSSVKQAFQQLVAKMDFQTQCLVVNIDDEQSSFLLSNEFVVTYGFSPRAHVCITHVSQGDGRQFFTLEKRGVLMGEFMITVAGRHNILNATAAILAAQAASISLEDCRAGLKSFGGTRRRFEYLGEKNGVIIVDDYAHHPAEIQATLKGAKEWYTGKRIIAVFQPHTYSRTKMFLTEFSKSFRDADRVLLTDIYASAREGQTLGLTGESLFSETIKRHNNVSFGKTKEDVFHTLDDLILPNDVIIFMGAGDIYTWGRDYLNDK